METSALKQQAKIVVLADLRYGSGSRGDDLGAILLRRAVERLNRFVRPEGVIVLGNHIAPSSDTAQAASDLRQLRAILDRLACSWVIMRGEEDPEPASFYRIMPEPPPWLNFGEIRVLCRDDDQTLRSARHDGFSGAVLQLQGSARLGHPAHADVSTSPRVTLHVNGGAAHGRQLNTQSLSSTPHAYSVLSFDPTGNVVCQRQTLAMPESLGLIDLHSHTQMAYCAGDVRADRSARVAEAMGLQAMTFTEHSGHLYFNKGDFNSGECCRAGVASANRSAERVDEYFKLVRDIEPRVPILLGMEIDTDFNGAPVIRPHHRAALDWAVGAVHFIPPPARDDQAEFVAAFQRLTEGICTSGVIDVLAHPFRIFRREKREVPVELYPWLVRLLKRAGVAAEINFHTNEPHATFVRMCLESGVKLTFGSDAHDLWEVGEFFGHLQLLNSLGVGDNLNDYLTQPLHTRELGGATA
jgi:histidinol phosphatase-like PHP family hydrolase